MACSNSSIVFTIVGLGLNLVGIILLFLFGMPFRVRRNGNQYLVIKVDEAEKRKERWFSAVGWLGLALIVAGVVLQAIAATAQYCQTWVMNTTPEFWTAFFTAGLFSVALAALVVAIGQLRTVTIERTVKLLEEISSQHMEAILGFFDFAANKEVSRRAFSELFQTLIRARPNAIRDKTISDVAAAAVTARDRIRRELDGGITLVTDERRELELRRRLIAATNFFERLWALTSRKTIHAEMFFDSQSYNIVAVYFVLEEILNDLVKHEEFNFAEFRDLAVRAQGFLDWLPPADPLRTATFCELPLSGTSLRERQQHK